VIELSRVKQPSDDPEDRLWGFNAWRHLYFQELGRSKNTTSKREVIEIRIP